MNHLNVLGVVLARAGSRGLPNKHLRPLLGRPVIDWTFDHVAAAHSLTRVVVSTDCPDVRRLARQRGLTTVNRPASLATDNASVQDALIHAMDEVESRTDWRPDAVACIYGNVPLRPSGVFDDCIDVLASTGSDSVRTFQPVGKWHPRWMSRLVEEGRVDPCVPGSIHRRQELEPLFLHDGACFVVTRTSLESGRIDRDDPHAMFGQDRRGLEVSPRSAIEVDDATDLVVAEAVLAQKGLGAAQIRVAA
jgi:CMP-N-acetylneuraminic acid synthetase